MFNYAGLHYKNIAEITQTKLVYGVLNALKVVNTEQQILKKRARRITFEKAKGEEQEKEG